MSTTANIFFPLETTVREFEFRLLLAAKFIRRDRRIFIGRHEAILQMLPWIRGGLYVGKNVLRPHEVDHLEHYQMLKDRDLIVLYHDEEGAVFAGGPDDWRKALLTRVDPRLWAAEDYVCTWGTFQEEVYGGLVDQAGRGAKVLTTGHPRFDLYRDPYVSYFEPQVEQIRREMGDFVLINTNFPRANHQYGNEHVFSYEYGYDSRDPEPSMNSWLHVRRVMTNFIELVHTAALRFPDTRFVIRPHPSEEWSFYQRVFTDRPNVVVRHEGPVTPWLKAARAVVHDGCTTGIEAYLAGARLINYRTLAESSANVYLPNLFGRRASKLNEVLDYLDEFLGGAPPDPVALPQQALDLLHNFEQESFGDLVDCMEEALGNVARMESPSDRDIRLAEASWQLKEGAKDLVRPLFRRRYYLWKNHRSRFRSLEKDWVVDGLRRVEAVTGVRMEPTIVSARLMYLDLG